MKMKKHVLTWISWFSGVSRCESVSPVYHPSCFLSRTVGVSTRVSGHETYQPSSAARDLWPGNVWRGVTGSEEDQRWWGRVGSRETENKLTHTHTETLTGVWHPWDQWKRMSQGSKVKTICTAISTFLRYATARSVIKNWSLLFQSVMEKRTRYFI